MGVMAYSPLAGGWLSGRYRKGPPGQRAGSAARQQRFAAAFDAASPANAAKLDAADALGALADQAGLTLIQMAVAFVIRHPAVTAAIIGPRTMKHLDGYLAADGIELSADVLDRIDQIVPPQSRSTSPTTCGTSARQRWTPRSAAGSRRPATESPDGPSSHGAEAIAFESRDGRS
jgi:aryl-alcohol dehydrogenase-like predicted oxidoreductase